MRRGIATEKHSCSRDGRLSLNSSYVDGLDFILMSATEIPTLSVGGAVVIFAKCPIAGTSKTRLAPLLGKEGAAMLAKAMLLDVLVSLSECVRSFTLYEDKEWPLSDYMLLSFSLY